MPHHRDGIYLIRYLALYLSYGRTNPRRPNFRRHLRDGQRLGLHRLRASEMECAQGNETAYLSNRRRGGVYSPRAVRTASI